MANNSSTVSREILISSLTFKFFAMIIGVLGNITVITYTIFTSKKKTATSYLIGNLTLADLLVCLTFYPIWMIEFILTLLNIDGDHNLFCKLSCSRMKSLLFASVATLLAIAVDRFLYIVKPLKHPLVVTKRRYSAVAGIWITACCVFIVLLLYTRKYDKRLRGLCFVNQTLTFLENSFTVYLPLTTIIILHVWILVVAEKQRKRILAETTTNASDFKHFFCALKAIRTFIVVVAVLAFCVMIPTVVGLVLNKIISCTDSCLLLWCVVFHYEFYGIHSIVNVFIYGMRHIKYRKALGHVILRILLY